MGFSRPLFFLGSLLLLALNSSATPVLFEPPTSVVRRGVSSFAETNSNSTTLDILTADEIHANILRNWPAAYIISADELPSKFAISAADETYYIRDTQSFTTVPGHASEERNKSGIISRQSGPTCVATSNRQVTFAHAWWGPWHTVTGCLQGDRGDGGSISKSVTDSYSVTVGGGVSISGFTPEISAAFEFSVTTGRDYTTTWNCNLGPGEHVEIWARHRMAWAAIQTQQCLTCGGIAQNCQPWKRGYANAMADSDPNAQEQWGCTVSPKGYLKNC